MPTGSVAPAADFHSPGSGWSDALQFRCNCQIESEDGFRCLHRLQPFNTVMFRTGSRHSHVVQSDGNSKEIMNRCKRMDNRSEARSARNVTKEVSRGRNRLEAVNGPDVLGDAPARTVLGTASDGLAASKTRLPPALISADPVQSHGLFVPAFRNTVSLVASPVMISAPASDASPPDLLATIWTNGTPRCLSSSAVLRAMAPSPTRMT